MIEWRENRKTDYMVAIKMYPNLKDAENRIKELEYAIGADHFCMQNFYATKAALRTVMVVYNWMALFIVTVLQSKVNERATTIRLKCFSIGCRVVKSGGNVVLKMSAAMKKRVSMNRWPFHKFIQL